MLTADTGRVCTKCKTFKLFEFFHTKSAGKNGFSSSCKTCLKVYYQNNKEAAIKKAASWKKTNPDKRRLSNRKSQIKTTYGISWEEYLELYNKAFGQCQICKVSVELAPSNKSSNIAACVDHDHTTGKVRGILCRSCNVAIGHFYDSKERIWNAYKYLEETDGFDS